MINEIILKFLKDNDLKFNNGHRNTPATVVSGFALHKDISLEDCIDSLKANRAFDIESEQELTRVYNYAKANNYARFWETPAAASQYKF